MRLLIHLVRRFSALPNFSTRPLYTTPSVPLPTHNPISPSSDTPPIVPLPDFRTQPKPIYCLPHYGASDVELGSLADSLVTPALRAYGGLIRARDDLPTLRSRLRALTNANYRPQLLTMEGVVVSDKMNKSVVVVSRRSAYSKKMRVSYWKTRRFMAHDEFDLCREGDRVLIRSCRKMSRWKSFVVVVNYGDRRRGDGDDRGEKLKKLVSGESV